jgi:hypothetical protein
MTGFVHRRKKILATIGAAAVTAAIGFIVPKLLTAAQNTIKSTPDPLNVQVITDIARFRSSVVHIADYVIPRPVSNIGAPPNAHEADPQDPGSSVRNDPARYLWAHQLGGVDADESLVRLSISGTSSAATVLQQLRVRVIRCGPPLPGTLVSYTGLGDAIGTRFFSVVLDKPLPTVQYYSTHQTPDPQQPFPLRVTDSIQEEFDVSAGVFHSDCDWDLLLDWTHGSRTGTTVISNNGKPFRTTSSQSRAVTMVAWNPHRQRWVAH